MTLRHANIIYMLWEPDRRGLRFGKPIRLVLKERALQGLRREVVHYFQENRTFPGRTAQGRHKASRASPLGRARATCFEWSALVSADHYLVCGAPSPAITRAGDSKQPVRTKPEGFALTALRDCMERLPYKMACSRPLCHFCTHKLRSGS